VINFFPEKAEAYAVLTLAISGASLFLALVLEYGLNLEPCPLCLMQRFWLFVAGIFAFFSLMHTPRWGIYPLCSIISALLGAGFAIRQLYLQNLPEGQAPSCSAPIDMMVEQGYPMADILSVMIRGTGACADIAWTLGGLSIPAWALISFVLVLAISVMQLIEGLN